MISAENQSTSPRQSSLSIRRTTPGDKYLRLKTLGRPMSVKVDAKKEAPRILSTDDAIKMKVETELSDRQLFAVLRCLRAPFGKSSIKKRIKSTLQDRKNIFESLFEVKKGPMESSGGAITPHSVVYRRDADLFINRIAALRCKAVSDFRVKFGIDYGQSFQSYYDPDNRVEEF